MSGKLLLDENVEVFDTDGVQILWRGPTDWEQWLDGKNITTVQKFDGFGARQVITRIQIVGNK